MDTVFKISQWLGTIGGYGLILAVVWGLLATMVRDVRQSYGNYLMLLSYLLGLTLWLLSLVIVHDFWGGIGIVIGLFLAGIGIVPLSMIAAGVHGEWKLVGHLLLAVFFIFLCRYGGTVIAAYSEECRNRESDKLRALERRIKVLEQEHSSTPDFGEEE